MAYGFGDQSDEAYFMGGKCYGKPLSVVLSMRETRAELSFRKVTPMALWSNGSEIILKLSGLHRELKNSQL